MYEMTTYNPDAADAMSMAHEIREETGADMSTALSEAWDEIRGGNPATTATTFEASPFTKVLLLAGIGTIIHRLVAKQWWWQSIQLAQERKRAVAEAQRLATNKAQAAKNNPEPPTAGYKSVIPLSPPVHDQWGRQVEEGVSIIIP